MISKDWSDVIEYFKETIPECIEIVSVGVTHNKHRDLGEPSYFLEAKLFDKDSKESFSQKLNALKIKRDLEKEKRYGT